MALTPSGERLIPVLLSCVRPGDVTKDGERDLPLASPFFWPLVPPPHCAAGGDFASVRLTLPRRTTSEIASDKRPLQSNPGTRRTKRHR